jgi:hypothetical protein
MTEAVAGPLPATHGEGGSGKVLPFPATEPGSTRRHAPPGRDAGAREDTATDSDGASVAARLRATIGTWVADVRAEAGAANARRSIWSDPAESLAEHAAYIRAARWSDWPPMVLAGFVYGWVAFAYSAAVLATVWLARRPSRLLVATVVALVVWLTI